MARIPTLIEDPQVPGRIIGVNRKRLDEIPYWLMTDLPANIVTVPANQSSPLQTLVLSGVGPMRITSFGIQRTAACEMFMRVQDGDAPNYDKQNVSDTVIRLLLGQSVSITRKGHDEY